MFQGFDDVVAALGMPDDVGVLQEGDGLVNGIFKKEKKKKRILDLARIENQLIYKIERTRYLHVLLCGQVLNYNLLVRIR